MRTKQKKPARQNKPSKQSKAHNRLNEDLASTSLRLEKARQLYRLTVAQNKSPSERAEISQLISWLRKKGLQLRSTSYLSQLNAYIRALKIRRKLLHDLLNSDSIP